MSKKEFAKEAYLENDEKVISVNGIISHAVQAGIPIDLAKQALEKGIDVKAILERWLVEERPNRWPPSKVRFIKQAVQELHDQQMTDDPTTIKRGFYLRFLLLMDAVGLTSEDHKEMVQDAQRYFQFRES